MSTNSITTFLSCLGCGYSARTKARVFAFH